MNTTSKHILIADDHGVVRYGMMLFIKDLMPWAQVSQVGTFNEAIGHVNKSQVDLVILDINLPGGNNIKMVDSLKAVQPDIKVIIFSSYDEKVYAERYLRAGAKGYLNKETSNKEIKKAIQSVLSGGVYMSNTVKDLMLNRLLNIEVGQNPLSVLSNREIEVAQLLVIGQGVTEISTALNLQLSTVSTYKNRIFEKLDVSNVVQLIEKFKD
jgi:DNA-binding NarL/FixJ family response regulator